MKAPSTEAELTKARQVLREPARYQEHHGLVAWAQRIVAEHRAQQLASEPQRSLFADVKGGED